MNRDEFLRQLEWLLQDISPSEREEALQYYRDYFADAGEDNEQSVIESLGSPQKVAENIKKDLYGPAYDEVTYRTTVYQKPEKTQRKSLETWMIVLIVIACVIASPAIFGVLTGIVGVLVGVISVWFSLILVCGVLALVLFCVMGVLVVAGIAGAFVSPVAGLGVFGIGLLCGGLAILALMATVALAGIATPAICRGIAALWRQIFGKKKMQ